MENKTPRQMQREQYLMRKQGVQPQPFQPMQAGGPGGMEPRFSQPFQPPQGWAQPNFANDKGFTMERGMGGGLPTQYGPMNGAYGQPLTSEFGRETSTFAQQPQSMSQEEMQRNWQQLVHKGPMTDAMQRFEPMQRPQTTLQAPGAIELQPWQPRMTAPNTNYENAFGPQAQPEGARGRLTAPNTNYQNAFGPRAQGPGQLGRVTAPNLNYQNSQGPRRPKGLMAVKPPRV